MKTIPLLAACAICLTGLASAEGAADLIRLHEEEILAHDLYVALSKVHPELMPLRNIPSSEARHRDTMAAILAKENIVAPEIPEGRKFASAGLDELFGKWLEEGCKSPADACRVGVRLEEHDIADLRKAQAAFPAHKEELVQLEAASHNHLRAFHRNLVRYGGTYRPEVLTRAEMNAILGAEQARCGEGKRGGGQGRGKGAGAAMPPASGAE